ncbi:MAG: TRAP transporter substrate-binding protein [Deltaproteobacteria bacterium]|nr:TRAP transporter substrate-binding protein [Deltaproteobacteria bacterium]
MRKGILTKLFLCAGIAACVLGGPLSVSAAKYSLKAGHVLAEAHSYTLSWKKVSEIVKQKTNGDMTIDVFANSTLGNERDLIEGMQLGAVDLAVVSTGPMSGFSPAFLVLDLPFIFPSYEAAYKVLDTEIGQGMLDSLSKNKLKGFCYWENGFRNITAKKNCANPEDVKGLKIRTMEAEVHMATFNNLGAIATPMAFGEVYTALQQGTIDAQENPIANIYQGKFHEVNRFVIMTRHFYAPSPVLMSKAVWDKLPAEYQKILSDAIIETRTFAREEIKRGEKECAEAMKKEGVTIIDNVDIAKWRKAVQPTYDQYEKKIGKELIEKVQAIAAGK